MSIITAHCVAWAANLKLYRVECKVIIHRSCVGVSLVEQDTIENGYVAYLKFIIKFFRKKIKFFFCLHFMQLFSADATIFLFTNFSYFFFQFEVLVFVQIY